MARRLLPCRLLTAACLFVTACGPADDPQSKVPPLLTKDGLELIAADPDDPIIEVWGCGGSPDERLRQVSSELVFGADGSLKANYQISDGGAVPMKADIETMGVWRREGSRIIQNLSKFRFADLFVDGSRVPRGQEGAYENNLRQEVLGESEIKILSIQPDWLVMEHKGRQITCS